MKKGVIKSQLKMDYVSWSQLNFGMVTARIMKEIF